MHRESTAQQIVTAARRLLDEEGPEAVTMRRVAQAVGITAMAVYRHFEDRADLLATLADGGFDEVASRLTRIPKRGSLERRTRKMIDVYLKHALHNPRLFELMFLKPRQGARRFPADFQAGHSPTANLSAELVKEGVESGFLRSVDPWEFSFELGALLQGLIMLYLGGRIGLSQTQFRAFCHRAVWRHINGIRQ